MGARSERRCEVGAGGGLGLGIGEAWAQVRSSRGSKQGAGKGNSVSTAQRTVGGPKAALGGGRVHKVSIRVPWASD